MASVELLRLKMLQKQINPAFSCYARPKIRRWREADVKEPKDAELDVVLFMLKFDDKQVEQKCTTFAEAAKSSTSKPLL